MGVDSLTFRYTHIILQLNALSCPDALIPKELKQRRYSVNDLMYQIEFGN